MSGTYVIVENNQAVGFIQRQQGIQTKFIESDEAGLGWMYDANSNTFIPPVISVDPYVEAKRIRDELIQSDLQGFQMKAPSDIINIQETITGLSALPQAKAMGLVPSDYPETVYFRKSDNTFQSMTLQDMQTLYLTYLLRKQQAWAQFQATIETL